MAFPAYLERVAGPHLHGLKMKNPLPDKEAGSRLRNLEDSHGASGTASLYVWVMDEIFGFGLGALHAAQVLKIPSANPAAHADSRAIRSRVPGGGLDVKSCVVHGDWRLLPLMV